MAVQNLYTQDRSKVSGQKPGLLQVAYICALADFTVIGAPGAGPGETKLTIPAANDHTFTGDLGWMKLYSLPHKNTGSSKTNGDHGALNLNHEVTMFFPGDSAQLLQALLTLKNDDVLVLVKTPDGKVLQFGDANIPANVEDIDFQQHTTKEGVVGYTFKVMACTKYWYQGDITEGDFTV